MSGEVWTDLQYLYYSASLCVPDVIEQGFHSIKVHLAVAVLIRIIAGVRLLPRQLFSVTYSMIGTWLLWHQFGSTMWYFVTLAGVSYVMLHFTFLQRGPLLGAFAVMYIVFCELFMVDPGKWHEIRGSMLMMIMKLVSLAFDMDVVVSSHQSDHDVNQKEKDSVKVKNDPSGSNNPSATDRGSFDTDNSKVKVESAEVSMKGTEKEGPRRRAQKRGEGGPQSEELESRGHQKRGSSRRSSQRRHPDDVIPPFFEYMSFTLSPLTATFGPFLSFSEHQQIFDKPAPLSLSWILYAVRSLVLCTICLVISVCILPDLFLAPTWNKWFVAYCSAASFRYSHYFISYLSEALSSIGGLGYSHTKQQWGQLRVVKPLDVEVPRSLGMVVTSWNLSMHRFLKNYVYKPSIRYYGTLGAVLTTYLVSSLLHGLNLQLFAVLFSIGLFAYIENVLRYKLSKRLSACVLDRPCKPDCSHSYKRYHLMVIAINMIFMCLAVFNLAYLGQMFLSDPEMEEFDHQGFSIWHTLRKWSHLNFLSHIVMAAMSVATLVI